LGTKDVGNFEVELDNEVVSGAFESSAKDILFRLGKVPLHAVVHCAVVDVLEVELLSSGTVVDRCDVKAT